MISRLEGVGDIVINKIASLYRKNCFSSSLPDNFIFQEISNYMNTSWSSYGNWIIVKRPKIVHEISLNHRVVRVLILQTYVSAWHWTKPFQPKIF